MNGKGKKYDTISFPEAFEAIKRSHSFLQDNQTLIRENILEKLPKLLNGPEGNFAATTIDSVALIQWGIERLMTITSQFECTSTSLLTISRRSLVDHSN